MRGARAKWAAAVCAAGAIGALAGGGALVSAEDANPAATTTKIRQFGGTPTSNIGAVVRRTKYGVPHIVAKDFESASYASAYAFAEDNLCTLADTVVTIAGERSRWFGAENSWVFSGNGTRFSNLDSDFYYGRINQNKVIEKLIEQKPPQGPVTEIHEAVKGFVAGYNAYLKDVGGAKGVPDPRCQGKAWVRPLKEIDLYRRFHQLGGLASAGVAIDGISRAAPLLGGAPSAARQITMASELERRFDLGGLGSNAYGLGGDATDNGRGMVLGNPHFPWAGSERLYQAHITIPGKMDVSGAALYGVPAILIGHTRGLAWSHTVATAWRFTPYELKLVPGDATSYFLDGKPTKMKATRLTVRARRANGSTENISRTLYETVHGPMFTSLMGLPLFPWTPVVAYAMADANANNFRYLNHFIANDRAQSVREYHRIQERYQGIPWVNSLAADSTGESYFSMNGAIPNAPNSKVGACQSVLGLVTFTVLGMPTLDGARSSCRWDNSPNSAAPGVLPNDKVPHMFRRDFVANGNDSHWLTNPKQPLEGFDRIVGTERTERTLRTRLGIIQILDRLGGRDGRPGVKFTLDQLQDVALSNRQYLGELWRDSLVKICRANPTINGVDVREACEVLARWDLHDELDSPGAMLFRRFASRALPSTLALPAGTQGATELGLRNYSYGFQAGDPVHTPFGLQDNPFVRKALTDAIADLRRAGWPLDATLRGRQFDSGGGSGVKTSIHGGPGGLGVFNAITTRWNGAGYDAINHGSSFIMAAQFTGGSCPVRARTFVTYGQSENPRSPHRVDYTRAFSEKRWNSVPFCMPEILRERELSVSYIGNACTPRGGLRSARVGGSPAAVRISFRRVRRKPVTVTIYRATQSGLRRVARLTRSKSFTWRPAGLNAGIYVARYAMKTASGRTDVRLRTFRAGGGKIARDAAYSRDETCGMLRKFGLSGPLFGSRGLRASYRLDRTARVTLRVVRGRRTVRKLKTVTRSGEKTYSVHLRGLSPGRYRVVLSARSAGGRKVSASLSARR